MTCGILLWATVGIHACAIAENSAVIVQGGVGFAATAGRILWETNVVTPEPALIIRTVFRVAAEVTCGILLWATVGIHAYAVAENSALIVQGGVGFATTA